MKLNPLAVALLGSIGALAATHACAQAYPTRSIRLIVPSTPGGSVDTLARTIAPRMSKKWGQQVIVENHPGAGGAIAAEIVVKSPPDGYALLIGTIAALATNVSLRKHLPYDPLTDLAPVTQVASQNLMLLVHPSVPVHSVKALIAFAKANPGQLTFASAGNGTGGHLAGELFKMLAHIDMRHVPYRGVAPALVDVIAGQVSLTFASLLSGTPQYKAGRLRALAVTGAKRSAAVPELPTMQEAGVPGYLAGTWYGIVAAPGTPPEVIDKLNHEIVAIINQPALHDRLAHEGAEPVGSSPAEFHAFMKAEIEKWAKVIKAAGITPG